MYNLHYSILQNFLQINGERLQNYVPHSVISLLYKIYKFRSVSFLIISIVQRLSKYFIKSCYDIFSNQTHLSVHLHLITTKMGSFTVRKNTSIY